MLVVLKVRKRSLGPWHTKMRFITSLLTTLAYCEGAIAAFGLTSTNARFIVDTDGDLVFEVNRHAHYNLRSSSIAKSIQI